MAPGGLSEAEVSACLEKVLHSASFAHAERLQEFLRFIVNEYLAGRSASLKETVIGVAVFGRDHDYDPKADNIVRTAARRVRSKLDGYYLSEGSSDPVRIQLPKGSYIPEFEISAIQQPAAAAGTIAAPVPIAQRAHRHRLFYVVAAVSLAAVLLSIFLVSRTRTNNVPWHSVPFTSAPGYQTFPTFSPDGTQIAYTWGGAEDGARQIYVQPIGSQSAKPLTTGSAESVRPAWSPDGQEVAYVQLGSGGEKSVNTISVTGHGRRKIATLNGGGVWLCNEPRLSWSPSGDELVTVEETQGSHNCGIVRVDLRSGNKRPVTVPPTGVLADVEPAFSPDGRSIAFLRQSSASMGDLFVIPASGGRARQVTSDHREIRGFGWAANGKSLIVCSRREGDFLNLWQLPLHNGTAIRLTEGPASLGFPSASKRGDRIAYVAYLDDVNIWRLSGGMHQLWIESRRTDWTPEYSPDGTKISFSSDRAGNMDVWIADADGRNPVRVTNFSPWPAGSASWSPDGRRLAFDARVQGQSHVYIVDAQAGHQAHRLTKWPWNEVLPSWSHDGRFVYFASVRSGISNVYRVAVEGGDPMQITKDGAVRALESADGRFLYFNRDHKDGLWRLALSGPRQEQAVLPSFPAAMWPSWTLGKEGLYYLGGNLTADRNSSVSINLYRPESGTVSIVGYPEKSPAPGLSVSPDGKSILYCQRDQSGSDILVLER